jgi:hypothetical protein
VTTGKDGGMKSAEEFADEVRAAIVNREAQLKPTAKELRELAEITQMMETAVESGLFAVRPINTVAFVRTLIAMAGVDRGPRKKAEKVRRRPLIS